MKTKLGANDAINDDETKNKVLRKGMNLLNNGRLCDLEIGSITPGNRLHKIYKQRMRNFNFIIIFIDIISRFPVIWDLHSLLSELHHESIDFSKFHI